MFQSPWIFFEFDFYHRLLFIYRQFRLAVQYNLVPFQRQISNFYLYRLSLLTVLLQLVSETVFYFARKILRKKGNKSSRVVGNEEREKTG